MWNRAVRDRSAQRSHYRAATLPRCPVAPRRTHLVSAWEVRRPRLRKGNHPQYLCEFPSLCATLVVEPRGQVALIQPEVVAAGQGISGGLAKRTRTDTTEGAWSRV